MRAVLGLLVLSAAAAADPDPKVELGRRLFFDRTVSRMGRASCSSCHDPDHGFSDPREYSDEESGQSLRHSMPILDLADSRSLHWDGEFGSVREIIIARFDPFGRGLALFREIRTRHFNRAKDAGHAPDERSFREEISCGAFYLHAGPDRAVSAKPGFRACEVFLLRRLGEDDRYREGFRAAFGSPKITTDRILDALEAYVLSLRSGENALDRHRAGDEAALTGPQQRGLALFTGKAGCAACHVAEGTRPRLTDGGFHNTGVAFRPVERAEDEEPTLRGIMLEIAGQGAGAVNYIEEDVGKFKTPSLRDVGRRPPYMHDGSLPTLEDVVRFYDRGGIPNPRLDERMKPLGLSGEEVSDLVAFLHALTSDERPGVGPLPERKEEMRVRIVDLRGKALPGLRVEIKPAGDWLEGGRLSYLSRFVETDADGRIAFRFPPWTHVHLTSETHEIHYDWLIPDCALPMEVMAAPRDKVALKLRSEGSCPATLDARWAGSREVIATFRLVQRPAKGEAIYVAERRSAETPWVSAQLTGAPRELDLSGGWTDPIDERGDPDRRPRK